MYRQPKSTRLAAAVVALAATLAITSSQFLLANHYGGENRAVEVAKTPALHMAAAKAPAAADQRS
jgi:hypothetical protein